MLNRFRTVAPAIAVLLFAGVCLALSGCSYGPWKVRGPKVAYEHQF